MDRQTIVLGSLLIALGVTGCGEEPLGPASPTPEWATMRASRVSDGVEADRVASPASLASITSAKPGYRILLILDPSDVSQSHLLAAAFKAIAGRLRITVNAVTPATAAGQARLIEATPAGGVDAVCIVPATDSDLSQLNNVVQQARARKLPVVAIEDRVSSDGRPNGVQTAFSAQVGADAITGGRLAGQALMPLWGRAQAAVLASPGAGTARMMGFNICVKGALAVAAIREVKPDGSDAMQRTTEILHRFPDLGALFCTDENTANGALAAIASAGLRGRIAVVVYGATPALRARLNTGDVAALIDRHIDRIASDAARMAVGLSANRFEAGDTVVSAQEIVRR